MPIVTQSDDPNNSASSPGLEMDEFLPIVKFKNPSRYPEEYGELIQSDEEVTLSKYLDSDKRTFKILQLTTDLEQLRLTFTVAQGGEKSEDEDGYVDIKLSQEDDAVKLLTKNQLKVDYGDEIKLDIEWKGEDQKEFYIDFYANDDDDFLNDGEHENVFCGRIKVIFKGPNEWEFAVDKINEIKAYAIANNLKYRRSRTYADYHHCTDTHKHIIYKLLNRPAGLDLAKDQSQGRETPKDYEKAGESTTHGVRNKLMATTYAESSKIFTVVDINDNEVLLPNGQAGNTDIPLGNFKESPVEFMKGKCLDNGFYVFIGAYNDDYHSFTIIIEKDEDNFKFEFLDQLIGVGDFSESQLEMIFLETIQSWRNNFPMNLRLYQIRNQKK